ncbi:type I-F CRISPR-associated endoribonuclease Cas6/Csy4 [Agarivorans sp. QJM3NY_33]|uniref:type I-F CRISPR-associated endoribonuclease Cas6/Csy4 n=1 Tax=Agarivorans sp. QJM3NY_33 TaxID=3421432 RepID=UPI003D7C94C3
MKYYLDISLLPNDDLGHYFLWEKLYHQVHLALVDYKNQQGQFNIAAGFPQYCAQKCRLGAKLRLFAETESCLAALNIELWLAKYNDYLHITRIKPVPEKVKSFVSYARPAFAASIKQSITRRMKRHHETWEQASAHFEGYKPRKIKAPFVYIHSYSKQTRFPLFIAQITSKSDSEGECAFDSYGLTRQGSIPQF